jgi:glucosylceramidase
LGFGAGLSDTSAWLIHDELARSARERLMNTLFGARGIDLTYIRLLIGASDFTASGKLYTYDDLPPGRSDPSLRHFSVAHDLSYIIPTLRQARAINPPVFVLANPWSAPSWMKTNGSFDNFENSGSLRRVDYAPYAAYFIKFLRAYRRHGIVVDAVAPQNEPGVAEVPAMNLSERNEATFISQHLHPAFKAAGLRTQIYGLDMGWDMWRYATALATGSARRDMAGISWHRYFGTPKAMVRLHAADAGLIELVNECSPEIRPFSAAEAMIASLRNWASAVALWNLALDPTGGPVHSPGNWCGHCQGLVTIDEIRHRARFGLACYQVGQVSKFVARGAARIDANTFVTDQTDPHHFYRPSDGLDDVAFVNPDGTRVLVTYNNSVWPQRFRVSWHQHTFVYRQPPYAMDTFIWR